MRIYAMRGDTYVFAGRAPQIRHMGECLSCARKPPYPGPREFVSAAARDEWALEHAGMWPQHMVAATTEVLAP